jgi:hypothetical protein
VSVENGGVGERESYRHESSYGIGPNIFATSSFGK